MAGYGCPLTTSSGCGASGSAPGLGPGGWRFESCHPDILIKNPDVYKETESSLGREQQMEPSATSVEDRDICPSNKTALQGCK